jgi:hypothetical protein
LHYNNCQHIAHELLTIPYCYSPLSELAGPGLDYLGVAHELRQAGEACLQDLVRSCIVSTAVSMQELVSMIHHSTEMALVLRQAAEPCMQDLVRSCASLPAVCVH